MRASTFFSKVLILIIRTTLSLLTLGEGLKHGTLGRSECGRCQILVYHLGEAIKYGNTKTRKTYFRVLDFNLSKTRKFPRFTLSALFTPALIGVIFASRR